MKWSAGWGSACDPCAKAKTRCIRSQEKNGAKCTRCQSLDISCTQQVRKPRKKRLGRHATTLSDATLSQPLDTPGHLNNTTAHHLRADGASATISEDDHNQAAEPESNAYIVQVKSEVSGAFSAPTYLPGFHPFPRPTCTCLPEIDGKIGLETMEAPASDEALLSIYRTRLSLQFPFVIIPDGTTTIELQKSRPFLAKAIQMVASLHHRRSMWNQSKLMMRCICDAVSAGRDKSLDLLQGIIVFLGFYHYFCFAHGHFNYLAHLASSMIGNMRLDRPPTRPPLRHVRIRGLDPEAPKAMSNDEKRAILAVWYINSSFAVSYNKANSPHRHFTRHMEQCLEDLRNEPEYETDNIVVQLVRAQRMNEMVAQLHQSDQLVDVRLSPNIWTANLDNLLVDLDQLQDGDGQYKSHRYLVRSHHDFALLQLLEPQLLGIDKSRYFEAIAGLQNTPDYFHATPRNQKDAADTALRNWFESWLTIPVCYFFYMPMSGYLQLTNATTILLRRSRLVLLTRYRLQDSNCVEADANNASSFIGTDSSNGSDDLMLDLLERLASRLEEARIEMGAVHCCDWANDLLDLVAWKLRERITCIEKWAEVIAAEVHPNALKRVEADGTPKPGETCENEGDSTALQNVGETALWFDPLEELLLGGEAYESWL